QMTPDRRRLPQGGGELLADVVDLDRGESQACQPRRRAGLAHEPRQAVAGLAIPVTAQVDPGQHHLAMPLLDAAPDLVQHRLGSPAARGAAHLRDDAEVAREATAVLHLHEGSDAVEPRLGADTAERADVSRDRFRGLLAAATDDHDVLWETGETVGIEARAAPCDVDPAVRAGGSRGCVTRLAHRLVRDAAGVDDRDVGAVAALRMSVGEQALADLLRVDVR